jgi:hypothetical protein
MTHRSTKTVDQRSGADVEHRGEVLRQPHERDESSTAASRSAELAPVQRDVMAQAYRDVASGQQDTDCRANPRGGSSACPPGPDTASVAARAAGAESTDASGVSDTGNPPGARHDPGVPAPGPDGSPRH